MECLRSRRGLVAGCCVLGLDEKGKAEPQDTRGVDQFSDLNLFVPQGARRAVFKRPYRAHSSKFCEIQASLMSTVQLSE